MTFWVVTCDVFKHCKAWWRYWWSLRVCYLPMGSRIKTLCTYKAPGPDELPNWLLKDKAPFLGDPVCAIFNSSLRQGHVPKIWKQANIIPVPKIHPPKLVENDLRPISLTGTLSKILESFMGGWILEAVGHQLDTNQYGALKQRSTFYALVSVLHHWSTALDNGDSVRIGALGWILEGRMASVEGRLVPCGVGYGQGCPFRSRLGGLWSIVSSPSGDRGRAWLKTIMAYFEGHRTLFFVPIWQNLRGQFALASPLLQFLGRPVPPPRDVHPCQCVHCL